MSVYHLLLVKSLLGEEDHDYVDSVKNTKAIKRDK